MPAIQITMQVEEGKLMLLEFQGKLEISSAPDLCELELGELFTDNPVFCQFKSIFILMWR
jgi:hypothetical protein